MRREELANSGINFIGTGVSGGERSLERTIYHARTKAYELVAPILEKFQLKQDGEPCDLHWPKWCWTLCKMVHNGIEYGTCN